MYYRDRAELDTISKAGVSWYENELGNPVVRMNASFWLECESNDTAFTENVKKTGNWEAWVATAISRELSKKRVAFFDIGANVGYYTLMSIMANVPTYSYEPDHSVFQLLARSVMLNKAYSDNLWMQPQALSDKDGSESFYIRPNHSGANTIIPQSEEYVESQKLKEIKIHATTLDYEMKRLPEIFAHEIVLKVDAEGAEMKIWNGSKKFRAKHKTIWFIEWVPERNPFDKNEAFLKDVLATHDLQIVKGDGSLAPVSASEALEMGFETLVLRERE